MLYPNAMDLQWIYESDRPGMYSASAHAKVDRIGKA